MLPELHLKPGGGRTVSLGLNRASSKGESEFTVDFRTQHPSYTSICVHPLAIVEPTLTTKTTPILVTPTRH